MEPLILGLPRSDTVIISLDDNIVLSFGVIICLEDNIDVTASSYGVITSSLTF